MTLADRAYVECCNAGTGDALADLELLGKWGRGDEAHSGVLAGFEVAVGEVLG